jgi:hypothetical protein
MQLSSNMSTIMMTRFYSVFKCNFCNLSFTAFGRSKMLVLVTIYEVCSESFSSGFIVVS